MTLKSSRIPEVVKVRIRTKSDQAECSGSRVVVSTSFFAVSRKGGKCDDPARDLDLRPMTLKFFGFRAVVKEHVRAKFHRAKSSGS